MRIYFEQPNIATLREQHFIVDMHFHSRYSQDSSTPVDDILRKAEQLGITVALTDHNSIAGVLYANKIASGVIQPAIEVCTAEGKDIIPYFYTVDDLEEFYDTVLRPNIQRKSSLRSGATKITTQHLLEELKTRNCVISLPHPFAVPPRRSYSHFIKEENKELLNSIDVFEAINQTMIHKQNLSAIGWAVQHKKGIVGGSDGHILKPLGAAVTYSTAANWQEFLDDVKARRVMIAGEERGIGHQMMNATRILKEKILKNMPDR